jgi:AraC-like DNA-binding protein
MKYHNENFNGVFDFRCKIHNGWAMESHLHEYSEILYCKKGNCDVTVNGRRLTLMEKHYIWLLPNYIHQYHNTDAELICAVFSKDYIPLFFHAIGEKGLNPTPIPAEELEPILNDFHKLDNKNTIRISGYLNLISAKVMEKSNLISTRPTDSVLYQKVITYLSTHFREDITLKRVAKHFGYNEKYLSHALHTLTGMPFGKLLSFYRVEYAKEMLNCNELSISEIATESGFSALNSFNRNFKELTGMTPSQYKKSSLK